MEQIREKLGEFGVLTGFLHEPSPEMANVQAWPGILVLPGGGFRMCSDREAEPVAMAFYARGYNAFVLHYTTVTDKPDATIADPMRDVEAALSLIRQKAAAYRMKEKALAMIGFSGGAHLAASVAVHGPVRPDALVLGYPGILHSDLRALECPDIETSVDEKTPASFVFVTRDDPVTPPRHALAFVGALDRAGVDYELHIFRTGSHGLSLAVPFTSGGDRAMVNPAFARWFDLCCEWLTAKFGEFTVYGVNDGREGQYSIDVPIGKLFADERAAAVVRSLLPGAEQVMASPMAAKATLRALKAFVPQVTDGLLAKMDEELLSIR